MTDSASPTKTALFSSFRKPPELLVLARALQENHGWNIYASGGTAKFLQEGGIEVVDVATLVGEAILDHRVVTLSREIHAALLANLNNPKHMDDLEKIGISPIHLVYVDLYPLEEEIKKEGRTLESVIEKTDIGGPAMLRSAAKGRRIVLTNVNQFDDALCFIYFDHDGVQGRPPEWKRQKFFSRLAAEAEKVVMMYGSYSYRFHKEWAEKMPIG